jgi:hypothetical protein
MSDGAIGEADAALVVVAVVPHVPRHVRALSANRRDVHIV